MSQNYKKDIIEKLRAIGFTITAKTEFDLTITIEEYLKYTNEHNEELLKHLTNLNPNDLNERDISSLKFLLHIIIA